MTPLTTLRTAQLFQISWPRISSMVGNLIGSIGGLSASLCSFFFVCVCVAGCGEVLIRGCDTLLLNGRQLELQYAAETNALQPPHEYVPWVVVDGEPLYEDYENFLSYICKAYKGTTVLEICSEVESSSILQRGREKPIISVCYGQTRMPAFAERVRSAITSWIGGINMLGSL